MSLTIAIPDSMPQRVGIAAGIAGGSAAAIGLGSQLRFSEAGIGSAAKLAGRLGVWGGATAGAGVATALAVESLSNAGDWYEGALAGAALGAVGLGGTAALGHGLLPPKITGTAFAARSVARTGLLGVGVGVLAGAGLGAVLGARNGEV